MTGFTTEHALGLLELAGVKSAEFLSDARVLLRGDDAGGGDPTDAPPAPTEIAASRGALAPWGLDDSPPLSGGWELIDTLTGQKYKWADGNEDRYARFVRYHGTGDYKGMTLGLGYKADGDVVGFWLGTGGGSRRGITYFFPADDFTRSNELVSMIRGGGVSGKAGFAPSDALPPAYSGFKTDVLKHRVAGKWNVQAVVVAADDTDAMLGHTALQAKLRGLA